MPLLLCDFDDTLVDRTGTFERWGAAYLAELAAPPEDIGWLLDIDQRGLAHRPDVFGSIIDRYALGETVESLTERYHRDFFPSFRLHDDVIAALRAARDAGFKIAIVTNGSVLAQQAKLEATGVTAHVDAFCVAEGVGHWKPAREIFEIAAERCGEPIEGAWMVGDNPVADIGGARACGARTVWIRTGTWPSDLDYEPDYAVDSFPDAVALALG